MSGQNEKLIINEIDSIAGCDEAIFDDVKFQTLLIETEGMASMAKQLKEILAELKIIINTQKIRILDEKAEHNELVKNVRMFAHAFAWLRSFDLRKSIPQNQTPTDYIEGIQSDFWFNGQEIIRIISPWVNFYKAAEVDLSQYERTSKKILGEIESMRDSARDNLFKLGGSYHTTDYFEEAKGWKKASNIWLIANIVLQVLSVGFVALLLYWLVSNPVNNIKAIDRLPYFAILALLYSAIFWCSRNYRASMHQYSVCKSKGVMLRTFQTFIDASGGDPEVKNAVLLTVTRSIFSHIDSGFSNSKETNIDLSSKILDVSKKT